MYFNNLSWVFSFLYPSLVWNKKVEDKVIYLTFDDGPIPIVTEFVLNELEKYNAKATFFCVGDNISKHPEVYNKVLLAGHQVGNHTFNHIKGWETEDNVYMENVGKCEEVMKAEIRHSLFVSRNLKLFRPPHGLIKRSQIKKLKEKYQIIMWDVVTGDFDKNVSPEQCLNESMKYTTKGSIVVFHDSIKAEKNLRYALPKFLDYYSSLGYRFEAL